MNWLRKLSAMLLCLMLCLGLFSGCGSDVYIAKLALSGTAGTFDPQFAENQNSILVASNVFEGLLVEDPDGGLHPGAAEGYRFSKAMRNPGFIGVEDIRSTYLPMGFSQFKIEGRGLGSALVLEFLLYYLTKPEHQLQVREEIYLDNMLDLF